MLPINIQLFLESLLGKTDVVTEKNFSSDDLDVLRKVGDNRIGKATDFVHQRLLEDLEPSLKSYPPQAQARLVDEIYDFRPKLKKQFGYKDYLSRGEEIDSNGWLDAAKRSFTDPRYRIGTSLGNFGMEDKGDHYRVYDKYNWNGDFEKPIKSLSDIWDQASITKPTEFLNGLAELYAPKVTRPVDIKVYKK